MIKGYWPDPREVHWKPATIADLDTRLILGPSAQTWYGATWVYAPEETEVEFQFQCHPQTYLTYYLNSQIVQSGEVRGEQRVPVARKTVTLHQGWNQIMFRGFCVGYPPFRAGLIISGAADKLWRLKLSPTPPAK